MKIQDGYNDKPTTIGIRGTIRGIEMWIHHEGIEDDKKSEVLVYLTANELLALKIEVEEAAKSLFGINRD